MIDILTLSGSLSGLATLNVILVELFKKLISKSTWLSKRITFHTAWRVQLTSWIIAILTAFGLWFAGFGLVAGVSWFMVVVYGVLTALVSNGIYDVKGVQQILVFLRLKEKDVLEFFEGKDEENSDTEG